jgi:4-amino-4-deoxy-L-arabinose transferase-like glycosyltransferase
MQGARVLLLGLPILLVGLTVLPRFDGLYGQDPYAYFDYATGPLRDALLQLRPPPPFTWPPGYPLLVALASFALDVTPRAGQVVSLLAGALTPIFTALLAYEVWSRGWEGGSEDHVSRFTFHAIPLLAGLLAALVGQLSQSSVVVMADTTGLAAATLGMWALARYGRDDAEPSSLAWLLLAAAALAFAILARWAYALVAIPATAYALLLLARQGWRKMISHSLAAALVVVLVLSPMWLPALRTWTADGGEALPFAVDLHVYSWNPLNALRREFVTADGLLSYTWPNGLWYALAPAHRFYFTPLLAPLLLPGLWAVLRRRAAGPLFLLVGWAAVIFLFHAGAPWQNFRFNLAHLPPLAILVAIGVVSAAGWLAGRIHHVTARRVALLLLTGYVLAGMLLMAQGGRALTRGFVDRKNANLALVRQVEAAVPPDADLVTFGLTLTFQHSSHLPTHEIFYLDEAGLAALARSGRPLYLLLDLQNVQRQWLGRPPEANYRWLQENATLRLRASLPPYTLFEVQSAP